jgi:hypothetical protein
MNAQPPLALLGRAGRNVEASALALLIERYPDLLTLADLIEAMTVEAMTAERAKAIELAVNSLTAVGLLELRGVLLMPTPAALRIGELELGL